VKRRPYLMHCYIIIIITFFLSNEKEQKKESERSFVLGLHIFFVVRG